VPNTFGIISGRVTYVIDEAGVVRHVFSSQIQAVKHVEGALKSLAAIRSNHGSHQKARRSLSEPVSRKVNGIFAFSTMGAIEMPVKKEASEFCLRRVHLLLSGSTGCWFDPSNAHSRNPALLW